MLCVFCGDNNHFSQNCTIYVSDEDRHIVLRRKGSYCSKCLGDWKEWKCCIFNKKCYICFSRTHHTVYCPDRLKVTDMFPNIDNDLLPRFVETLSSEEKYHLMFSFPKILNFVKLKPLKVKYTDTVNLADFETFIDADVVVGRMGIITDMHIQQYLLKLQAQNVHRSDDEYEEVSNTIKQMAFRIKHLQLQRIPISSDIFLNFLSTKTIILICSEVEFLQNLSFRDILISAPNLEIINIKRTDAVFDETWPDDVLQFNQKLNQISFTTSEINVNAKSLANLMMTRPISVYIIVDLPRDTVYNSEVITEMITAKFFPYFVRVDPEQFFKIQVSYVCNSAGFVVTEEFNMKTFLID